MCDPLFSLYSHDILFFYIKKKSLKTLILNLYTQYNYKEYIFQLVKIVDIFIHITFDNPLNLNANVSLNSTEQKHISRRQYEKSQFCFRRSDNVAQW